MLRSGGSLAALLAGASSAVSICGAQPIERLADLSEARRNSRLGAAIRDAGFVCEKVVETTKAEAPVPAWRVVCNDALVYLASSDENDDALPFQVYHREGLGIGTGTTGQFGHVFAVLAGVPSRVVSSIVVGGLVVAMVPVGDDGQQDHDEPGHHQASLPVDDPGTGNQRGAAKDQHQVV